MNAVLDHVDSIGTLTPEQWEERRAERLAGVSRIWNAPMKTRVDKPPRAKKFTGTPVQIVLAMVADRYYLTADEIVGERRHARFIRPRQLSMFLMREILLMSYEEIGTAFGWRHHTTAMHGVRQTRWRLHSDKELAASVDDLRKRVESELRR